MAGTNSNRDGIGLSLGGLERHNLSVALKANATTQCLNKHLSHGGGINMLKLVPLAAFAVFVGYPSPGQAAPRPKAISFKEATAYELSLLARESAAPKAPEPLYVQPANKSEACRLPTTQGADQMQHLSFSNGERLGNVVIGRSRRAAADRRHQAFGHSRLKSRSVVGKGPNGLSQVFERDIPSTRSATACGSGRLVKWACGTCA